MLAVCVPSPLKGYTGRRGTHAAATMPPPTVGATVIVPGSPQVPPTLQYGTPVLQ